MQRISTSSPSTNPGDFQGLNINQLSNAGAAAASNPGAGGFSLAGNVDQSSKILQLRTELFEHGLFPVQSKLSANVLINTFTNLNLLSSIDYKIKLNNWVDQAKRHIPDMTEQDANIYFVTYRALLEDVDSPSQGPASNTYMHSG